MITRSSWQNVIIDSTIKLYDKSNRFIGTGFFISPNLIVSCLHVFEMNNIDIIKINDVSSQLFEVSINTTLVINEFDFICIDLKIQLSNRFIPIAQGNNESNDYLWGYTYNTDFENGAAITSKLIETASHNGMLVYRIFDDIIKEGSSGSPIWNSSKGTFLGIVYWLKEHKRTALVIPFEQILSINSESYILDEIKSIASSYAYSSVKLLEEKGNQKIIDGWKKKLEFLERELISIYDIEQKFNVLNKIKECKDKIRLINLKK